MPRKKYNKLVLDAIKRLNDDEFADHLLPEQDRKPFDDEESAYFDAEAFYTMSSDVLEAGLENPVARAFARTQLDPRIPFSWLYLLEALCEIHFSTRPKTGGRQFARTAASLGAVRQDYNALTKEKPQLRTKLDRAKELKKRFPEKYPMDAKSLVRLLTTAGVKKFTRKKRSVPKQTARKSK